MQVSDTPTAARVIRSSQGADDKVSLDVQRDETARVADENDATITRTIDLGIHTGFSAFVRGADSENRLDANDDILDLRDELEAGEYNYLIAYDSSRLARDDFFFVLQYSCILGDVEILFVEDIKLDSLSFRVLRVVEQYVKLQEIKKSREARQRRRDAGGYEGTPPFGTRWDDDRHSIEPDDNFDFALRVLDLKDDGCSHRDVVEAVDGVGSTATVSNILDRRELYAELTAEYHPDTDTAHAGEEA